jgi:hypothetical protein
VAYPIYAAVDTSAASLSGTTHSFNIGSPASNELVTLVVMVRSGTNFAASGNIPTAPAGWTIVNERRGDNFRMFAAVLRRVCDGTEGATLSITFLNNIITLSSRAWKVNAGTYAGAPAAGSAAGFNNLSPNPPSLTSGFGAVPTKWLAVAFADRSPGTWTFPASYTNTSNNNTGTNSDNFVAAAFAERDMASAATEDPGEFTVTASSTNWIAVTIAIEGAPSGIARSVFPFFLG